MFWITPVIDLFEFCPACLNFIILHRGIPRLRRYAKELWFSYFFVRTSLSIRLLHSVCGTLLGFEGEEHSIGSVDVRGDLAPIFEEVFAHDFMALCIINRDGQLLAVNAQYPIIVNKPTNALMRAHILEAGIPFVEGVDKFKLYTDAYGHLTGDDCLARAAKTMSAALFRPGDELFRYDGEEFAIIMPQTGKKAPQWLPNACAKPSARNVSPTAKAPLGM